MALNIEKMQTNYSKQERIPEGTFMSRVSSIVDLGIQEQTDWKTGEPTDPKARVLITWELPTETIEVEHNDGSKEMLPRVISKEYTLSNYDQSNLMKLIKSLKPNLKELQEFLDLTCMINIGSTKTGNAKVTSVMPAPAGIPIPELTKEASYFDFDSPSEEFFSTLPSWIKGKIKDANNYTGFADTWDVEGAQA